MPKKEKKLQRKLRKKLRKLKKEEDSNLVFFIKNASHNDSCERRFFLFV